MTLGPLLEVRHLRVAVRGPQASRTVVRDVGFAIAAGEALGLVGESGAGKSMTLRAILNMLPAQAIVDGDIQFAGRDVRQLEGAELRRYRSNDIGVVFQDPRAHVNPVRRVGDFLTEPLVRLRGLDRRAALRLVCDILDEIGVTDPVRRCRQYPHELSGGLLQRMMIASVVSLEPRLILADEPTTALDVTTQAEVMRVLAELRRTRGMALLLVTHDLDLAAAVCDRMAVMYAGTIVEEAPSRSIVATPGHPYTAALHESRPMLGEPGARLAAIPGRPLSAFEVETGCPFASRCRYSLPPCEETRPQLRRVGAVSVACLRAGEIGGRPRAEEDPVVG